MSPQRGVDKSSWLGLSKNPMFNIQIPIVGEFFSLLSKAVFFVLEPLRMLLKLHW
jgi:hypothetical protein